MINKHLYIILFFLCTQTLFPQETSNREVRQLFIKIEEGFNTGAIDKFSNYFNNRNYLSLLNGTSGYFSSNQSYYVIKDFLSVHQPISFKFNNVVIETDNPFAAGILKFNNNGIRGTAIVFITLVKVNDDWRLSQITIN